MLWSRGEQADGEGPTHLRGSVGCFGTSMRIGRRNNEHYDAKFHESHGESARLHPEPKKKRASGERHQFSSWTMTSRSGSRLVQS